MRWPLSLLFRGDRDAPAAADGRVGGPGTPAGGQPGDGQPGGAPPPPRVAAWEGLAPVQRTAGAIPLTAPAEPFARGLAGRRMPDPIIRPLAHDVAAGGPAGLVSGITAPLAAAPATVQAGRAEPAALPAPKAVVQRRTGTTSIAAVPQAGHGSGVEPVEGAPSLPAGPVGPLRTLPAMAPVAPALAATRVAEPTAPAPVRPLARAVGAAVQRSAAAAPGGVPAPSAPAAGSPPASSPGDTEAGPRESDELPAVQRRSLAESRRLGLGAPIARRPGAPAPASSAPELPLARPVPAAPARVASAAPAPLPVLRLAAPAAPPATAFAAGDAVPEPDPTGGSLPGAGGAASDEGAPGQASRPLVGDRGRPAPTATRLAGPDEHGHDPAADGPPSAVSPTGPVPPVARLAGGTGRSSAAAVPAAGAGAPPPGGPAPGAIPPGAPGPGRVTADGPAPSAAPSPAAPGRTAPLVAARAGQPGRPPLRSTVAPGPQPAPAVVVARRAVAIDARAGTPARAIAGRPAELPGESPAPRVAGPAAAPGVADPAHGKEHAAMVQRAADASQSGPRAPSSAPAQHEAAPAGTSPGTPADLALPLVARPAGGGGAPAPLPASPAGWTPAGGFGPVPPEVGPVVQRTVAIGEVGVTAEAGPGGTGAAGEVEGGSAPDYEEIAENVYDRIRTRFATELLLDRERMGLLIDG